MSPSTFTFGPWLPDIANQGMPSLFLPMLGPVPAVDCLNVTFANGNYYCTPSPVPAGPTLGEQVRAAYTWYDNSGGEEIVFAGLSGGISALIDGAWQALPFINSLTTALTGWDLTSTWGTFQALPGWDLVSSLGTLTPVLTPDLSASCSSGSYHQPGTGGTSHDFVVSVTVLGGTATAWSWSAVGGLLSDTTIENPILSVDMNQSATINCTVIVNGNPLVASQGHYHVFNDS